MKLAKKYTRKRIKSNKLKKSKKVTRSNNNFRDSPAYIWEGYGLDILFGLIYLIKKYNNLCFPLLSPTNLLKTMTFSMICKPNVKDAKKKEHYQLRFPTTSDTLEQLIRQCSTNYRFIALPAFIIFDDCKQVGHMNVLLFDTNTMEIERFEPYGKKGYTKKEQRQFTWFDEYFKEWLKGREFQYKYISTKNCPSIGPQELEEIELEKNIKNMIEKETDDSGFCGVWGLLFLDLRLSYPDLSSKEVMKIMMELIKDNDTSIRNWIRNYSIFITNHKNSFIKDYNNNNKNNNKNNEWSSSLEREVTIIFKERVYGKTS